MAEDTVNEQPGEDPEILKDIANATQGLAVFLKLHDLEVDYWEADWKDGQELAEGTRKLCLKHPSWMMYYFSGDTWGIDANFVFFTSRAVESEVVEKIGELIVEYGAELPEEVVHPKPVCPKCGKVLDGLSVSWRASIPGIASIVDGELYTDTMDGLHLGELVDEDTAVYFCPLCDEQLFKAGQETEMIAFLKYESDTKSKYGVWTTCSCGHIAQAHDKAGRYEEGGCACLKYDGVCIEENRSEK